MATLTRKTDLSPLEAIIVEGTLGDEARSNGRDTTLARIQQLTKERQKLYSKSAAHPFLAVSNSARIRAIGAEIEQLWDLLRRERASRRAQIERALNVTHEDDDDERPAETPAASAVIGASMATAKVSSPKSSAAKASSAKTPASATSTNSTDAA